MEEDDWKVKLMREGRNATLLFITLDTLDRVFTIYRQTETVCRFEILSRFEGALRDALMQPSFGGMTTQRRPLLSQLIPHFRLRLNTLSWVRPDLD